MGNTFGYSRCAGYQAGSEQTWCVECFQNREALHELRRPEINLLICSRFNQASGGEEGLRDDEILSWKRDGKICWPAP